MKNRWIGVLACLGIMTSRGMVAQAVATMPPYIPPSAQAPTADLEIRMLVPDPRIASIEQVAYNEKTVGLVGRTHDGTVALWLYDTVQGTFAQRYEAPMECQIISPVFCAEDCYWAQWREDSAQGWEIMVLRNETGRIERIRADIYAESTMAPTLRTDGTTIYWYETDQPTQKEGGQIPAQMYCLDEGGIPVPLFSLQIANDGSGPAIYEKVLAVSRYEEQEEHWNIALFSADAGETLAVYRVQGRPTNVQVQGDRMVWLESETSEAEMGRIAALEEDDQLDAPRDREWALNRRLMLMHLDDGTTQVIDTGVEQALLLPFGIVYVNTSGILYCYSFLLEQPIRLSNAGDYQPVMDSRGGNLLVVRRIWTGEETLYRPEVLNLSPLGKGWPDLQ